MISFRIRAPGEVDWTQTSFDGPDEEAAAHLLAWLLAREGWTILVARATSPEEWTTLSESDELWSDDK